MSARRFFIEGAHTDGDSVALAGADAHKISHVLRLKTDDRIEIVDSAATIFEGVLTIEENRVVVSLRDGVRNERESHLRVDVAQGIPRGQKMDFVVEKLTELGVANIHPFESERNVARSVGEAKVARWRRLAKSAAQQCGRESIPDVAEPVTFDRVVEAFSHYDVVLFPWEVAEHEPLRDVLPKLVAGATRILVVVGPEGGFSHLEADRAAAGGAHRISLGSRILRTETAGLAVLTILSYLAS